MISAENQMKIAAAVTTILTAIGEDNKRGGIQATPERVAKMYGEIFSSVSAPEFDDYKIFPIEETTEMVLIKDISFYSMCEHHLLPFFGVAHIAYVPDRQQIIGLSKIPRLVDYCAKRPNVQEQLTVKIGQELTRILAPQGVAVSISARHMCVEMRGINKPGSTTDSSYYTGVFKNDSAIKREYLMRITK